MLATLASFFIVFWSVLALLVVVGVTIAATRRTRRQAIETAFVERMRQADVDESARRGAVRP